MIDQIVDPLKEAETSQSTAELLKNVYYKYTETLNVEVEEKVLIGEVFPIQDRNFVAYFMDWWVDYMDNLLDQAPNYSNQYADLLAKRGIKIEELKLVLSGHGDNESMKHERVFEYLFIDDKIEQNYFISKHSIDDKKDLLDKFLDVMTEAFKKEIPVLHEFFFASKIKLNFPIKSMERHTYIVGKTGSGKSEILKNIWYDLQANSIEKNKKSLVVVEPQGKLALELLKLHLNAENPERVAFLDSNIRETAKLLLGEDIFKEDYTYVLNPFHLERKTPENINYMTTAISSAIFELMDSESNKTGQMRNILGGCIDLLISMDEETSLIDLRDINDDEVKTSEKYLKHTGKMFNETRKDLMNNKFQTSRMAASKNGIYHRVHGIIEDYYLARIFKGKSTVDLENLLNGGKVIIFNPTSIHSNSIKAYGKLIVCLIQAWISKRKDNSGANMKTFFVIDEAQDFITPAIEGIMAKERKNGLHMILANQIIGQDMSTKVKRIILGNTAIKVAGKMDEDSQKEIGRAMGIKQEDFKKLPKYHFFINDSENEKAGTRVFRASSKLVGVEPPYYMDKQQLKDFLLWTVHESGYYVKVASRKKTGSKEAGSEDYKAAPDALKPTWSK